MRFVRRIFGVIKVFLAIVAVTIAVGLLVFDGREGWVLRFRPHRITTVVDDGVVSMYWCWFRSAAGSNQERQVFDWPTFLRPERRLRLCRYSYSSDSHLESDPEYRGYEYVVLKFPGWVLVCFLSVWPLIASYRAIRGYWWRIRGSRCALCGYDLRGSPNERCPECGATISDSLADKSPCLDEAQDLG